MIWFIWPRMFRRASRAWPRAISMISSVMPLILMSICSAVTPLAVPATLKSMSPRWSSSPRMSVRMANLSPSLTRPMAPVAGIAMGLVKEGDKFAILTDILGDEDHLGDMDFKVAGTAKGVTALQMDIKIKGITEEIMEIALGQALEARLNILGQMNQIIGQSRTELSENAPTMMAMQIDTDKIRDVIGKGGATIRAICEETKASIDIEDDGSIKIFGETKEAAEAARQRVLGITAEAEIGKIYVGKVERIVDFGAFVNILPGKDGLVHISMLSDARVEKVTDILKEGQEVEVLVLDVDNRGRIKLSIKDVAAAKASGV